MNVGFIGAGKAGTALGQYLVGHGISVVGYMSKTKQSAQNAASLTQSRWFDSLAELVNQCDFLIISTPDDALASVWRQLVALHRRSGCSLVHTIVVHLSGCCSSEVFCGAHDLGIAVCSMHPLLAFGDAQNSSAQLSTAHFSLEGDKRALDEARKLLDSTNNPVHVIETGNKPRYHAAAVFASNLVLAPLDCAIRLLLQCGFTEEESLNALKPLIRGNIDNFLSHGAAACLTGPVERGDAATLHAHRDVLFGKQKEAYDILSSVLIDIAKEKHPDRAYEELEHLLNDAD